MQSNSFVLNLTEGLKKRLHKVLHNPATKANLNWWKIKFLKHATSHKLRSHTYHGKKLYYTKPSELLHGLNEIFIDEIYLLNLRPQPYIVDCGANIGMSIIYLKEKFPDAEIIAFEPDDKNFDLLKKNIESFELTNVTLQQEAVWIADTEISFKSEGTMSSKIDTNNSDIFKVKAIRLKNILNRTIDFLKIDIEGAEYEVLKDVAENLQNVKHMFLEYHGKFTQNLELVEIFDIIQKAGFRFYIKEAANVYHHPFLHASQEKREHDIQLNIFCFRV